MPRQKTVREFTIQLTVIADAKTAESDVTASINQQLDEPPCDWGDWIVGAAEIVGVRKYEVIDGEAEG